ncbi:uncharacterized protein SPAPADRAFT_60831 [Spathaspora passalidarum NRRL Y-27907]|uniref:PH-response regulator protein palH/RIM21 n=1 Tax=Spathaspora passalidarum (strain NRRL Y-27907 / 11-Y1) TaxID=619300 RepID=G3AMP0_SPAPN|nr:uncharacterized protein SPAPADRAFT_60831 [Spathaspora passalidarum NRRL Y-27907]EGW33484.1 hypothetical protein SPAPADRAFT_60831 [Spathaspora passalidarum NRRL Y-27907]
MVVLSRLFTAIAWFQIALKISRQKYKWLTMTIGGVLITAHIVAQIYYQIVFDNSAAIFGDNLVGAFQHWKIARACLQLVILIWFAANILCYTTVIKSPRKVCYSRRLLPLAIFNWCLIVLNATLTILYVSLFRYNWLVKTWLGLLPYLLDVILITTVWEWIYKIWVLEKRFELMGVLGRKMSADEGMSINSDDIGRNKMVLQSKNKVLSMLDGILHIGNNKIVEDVGSVKSIELEDLSTKDSSMPSDQTPQSNEHSHQHLHHRVNFFVDDETPGTSPSNANVSPNTNPDGSDADYDDEIVDNYEIWGREEDDTDEIGNHEIGDDLHEVIVGSSNQFDSGSNDSTEPPPFQPLPGFSEEDYWNDEKR